MRSYCSVCAYPSSTCVCAYVSPVLTRTQIDILQHPSEVHHAKNTARLVTLCCPNARIWVGEQASDFTELSLSIELDQRHCALLYPASATQSVNEYWRTLSLRGNAKPRVSVQAGDGNLSEACIGRGEQQRLRLLFLDGTWKKAYKLLKLNSWLEPYPQLRLEASNTAYRIRKCSVDGGLSTLECVAQCLSVLEPEVKTGPLFDCFEHLQQGFRPR